MRLDRSYTTAQISDATLTRSFRFGPCIAAVANLVLFAKEKSPQTTGDPNRRGRIDVAPKKSWTPYRVVGGSSCAGQVFTAAACPSRSQPQSQTRPPSRCILAYQNISLLRAVLQDDGTVGDLKVAINGDGENSGRRKWLRVLRDIEACYSLFAGETDRLPFGEWKERSDGFSWAEWVQEVTERELSTFDLHIATIDKFERQTLQVLDSFRRSVVERRYRAEDADVIISTVHAAKGMEWDVVELCDDFCDLALFHHPLLGVAADEPHFQFAKACRATPLLSLERIVFKAPSSPAAGWLKTTFFVAPLVQRTASSTVCCSQDVKKRRRPRAGEFKLKHYGDDVNLWYVAVTRAKRQLILPLKLQHVFLAFRRATAIAADAMRGSRLAAADPAEGAVETEAARAAPDTVDTRQHWLPPFTSAIEAQGRGQLFTLEEVQQICRDLVQCWEAETRRQLPGGLSVSGLGEVCPPSRAGRPAVASACTRKRPGDRASNGSGTKRLCFRRHGQNVERATAGDSLGAMRTTATDNA